MEQSANGDWQATDFAIPTDDAGITRRVKGIVISSPINDLERNKSSYAGLFWAHYDLITLAAGAIDQVALAMGVAAGMQYDAALESVTREAARHRPEGGREEWLVVAEKVLAGLITDTHHTHNYVDFVGDAVHRVHEFRLLYEEYRPDGTTDLRASPAAINVLVDALDMDIESAQIASEAQMRALIQRGALTSAVVVAQRARYQTIQYLEQIRNITRDTLIDPDSHDWAIEVPRLLDSALDHIRERISAELELRGAVEDRRGEAVDPDMRTVANQLIVVLKECTMRHTELQRHLMQIRSRLRNAQDERFARPPTTRTRFDIERELLGTALDAPATAIADWADRLLIRFAAPRRTMQPTLARLLDELAVVPVDPGLGDEVEEPEFDLSDDDPWWVEYWEAAERVLAGITEPVLLSRILDDIPAIADAHDGDEPLDAGTLIAAVCHLAFEHTSTALTAAGGVDVLCAAPAGRRLVSPWVVGDDLWIAPGVLVGHPAGPPSDGAADFALAVRSAIQPMSERISG